MNRKKTYPIYRCIWRLVKLFYPKMEVVGAENLPKEPVILVGNHAQIHGPIAGELYLPMQHYTWCASQMMYLKEVPAYAYQDFWSEKPAYCRWFYKLLSWVIAPLSVLIFNNANIIGVYHDARIISTMRATVKRLQEGASVVIFPECGRERNNIVYDFQTGFVDAARIYYRKTGRELDFVPMYIAPTLKKIYLGEPVRFRATEPPEQEKQRIGDELMERITQLARSLPRHRVIPYKNLARKKYPFNISNEVSENEKTGG